MAPSSSISVGAILQGFLDGTAEVRSLPCLPHHDATIPILTPASIPTTITPALPMGHFSRLRRLHGDGPRGALFVVRGRFFQADARAGEAGRGW